MTGPGVDVRMPKHPNGDAPAEVAPLGERERPDERRAARRRHREDIRVGEWPCCS